MTVAVVAFAALTIEGLPVRGVGLPQLIMLGLVVLLVGAALGLRRREAFAAILLVGASLVLRIMWFHVGQADQILVSQAALERVLDGGGPYGIGYAETIPPGAPFPYGPLALLWWAPGPDIELAASVGVLLVLWWQRAWLTLAVFGSLSISVQMNTSGVNDYSPALILLLATVAMRSRPVVGAALLAVAAALKPYAFAWFLPAIGYGGLSTAVVLIGGTAVLWSPLFLWWGGPAAFLRSAELAASVHRVSEMALNVPPLRWLAVPLALLGLFVHSWEGAVLAGSAVFAVFLFFAHWASLGYWLPLIPIVGLVLERGRIVRGLVKARERYQRSGGDIPLAVPVPVADSTSSLPDSNQIGTDLSLPDRLTKVSICDRETG